jgi:hypothetical protein
MYGAGMAYDGHIKADDGSFSVQVGSSGGRHLMVVGKDRSPVKSFGIDVNAGGKNETGVLDLSGSCPK